MKNKIFPLVLSLAFVFSACSSESETQAETISEESESSHVCPLRSQKLRGQKSEVRNVTFLFY